MELLEGGAEVGGFEVGPHAGSKDQLRVGGLPQQEVAEPLLAAGSNQQVDFGAETLRYGLTGGRGAATDRVQNRIAAGVVDGQPQIQDRAGGSEALHAVDGCLEGGGEALAAAEDAQAHALLPAAASLAAEVGVEQVEERGYLGLRTAPVVGGEGVEGKGGDAESGRRLYGAADGRGPGAVAVGSRTAAGRRPASVAVHDDCYVQAVHFSIVKYFIMKSKRYNATMRLLLLLSIGVASAQTAVVITKPLAPPAWALAERAVLKAGAEAAKEFAARYVDAQGRFACVERWGGNDGLPNKYGDNGWYGYTPNQHFDVQRDIYLWSMKPSDRERIRNDPWIAYLEGKRPEYPWQALEQELAGIRRRVQGFREDPSTADTRSSDSAQRWNPVATTALVNLTLGGNEPGTSGNIVHSVVRCFDPVRRRAGLPEDVAALVEKIRPEEIVLTLVNTNQVEGRTVIVQMGAYGEHGAPWQVKLGPGAGDTLTIARKRYSQRPSLVFPWDR